MAKSRTLYLFAAVTLLLVCSCRFKEHSLVGTWFYAYNVTSSSGFQKGKKMTPENFIDLQTNGSFTSYFSRFEYGTWEQEKDRIHLQNQQGTKRVIQVISHRGGELILNVTPELPNLDNLAFTGVSNEKNQGRNNPFGMENNKWRIRASSQETSEQIRDRLINHFRYWEKYFEWAVVNNFQTLDISSSNSPLKLYGNGFKLIPFEELSDSWRNNFYNEVDCRFAWDKLKTMMDTKDVAWPKTDHRFKSFISVFQ